MRHFICILIVLFTFSSCDSSQSNKQLTLDERSELEAKEAQVLLLSDLEEKYQESFVINEFSFAVGLNNYEYFASPEANKEISFYGTYDERQESAKDRLGHDAYPNEKFSFAATSFYKSLFKNTEFAHVASADVYAYYDHTWGENIPSWDEYLSNRHDKSTIGMNTYFFEVPDNAKHPIIVEQKKILEALQEKYTNNFSLYVGYWPVGFLDGKKLEDLSFGFQSTSHEDADDLINVMQYLSKVLLIKIVHSSVEDIDEKVLFELLKNDNKNGMNEMTEI